MPRRVIGLRTTLDSNNPKHRVGLTKAPLSLCPPVATIQQALAQKDGADKYGEYNWRVEKVNMRIYIEAAQRHLADLLDGEWTAPDSGVTHAGHVMACMAIVLDAHSLGQLIDDRPIAGATSAAMKSAREWLAARGPKDTAAKSFRRPEESWHEALKREGLSDICTCGECVAYRRTTQGAPLPAAHTNRGE